MECSEVKQHLSAYFDGELSEELASQVKLALVDCPDCQQELEELTLLSELARDGFEAPVENVDFSGLPDLVMARIQAEETTSAVEGVKVERREDSGEGILDAITNFFGELLRFERPMAALGAAALVVLMVVGIQDSGLDETTNTTAKSDQVAQTKQSPSEQNVAGKSTVKETKGSNAMEMPAPKAIAKKKNRRQRAMEEPAGSRDMAAIESSRAPAGVRIDIDQDQGRPAIVWHVDESTEEAPN